MAEYPGGMEHTTCTTQTDAILIDKRAALDNDLDLLVAHELAHQWFGDLVTCRDWSHAWLNEGFATYFEVLFQKHDKGGDEADYELYHNAKVYFDEESRRYRRPIVCNTFKYPWTVFDRHTYEKGCWVLRMLHNELGEDLWWKVINHYLRKFRDQSVETADLIETIEEVSGRNLKPFFDQWIFKNGHPSFRLHYGWDAKTKKGNLWVLQTQDISQDCPLFKTSVEVRFTGPGWTKNFKEKISEKEHRFSFRLPSEPFNVEFDPDHLILKKMTLRKPQKMWAFQLIKGRSAWSRFAAAAPVAQWGDAASLEMLERAIRREPFWGAACEMVRALGSVKTESAFQRLKGLLKIKNPKVRRVVIEALSQFSHPAAGPLLAPFARRDPSLHVQAEACRALGALRDPKWLPLLRSKLKERSYRDVVSSGALSGLASSRDVSALEILRRNSLPPHSAYHRLTAIRALSDYYKIWPDAVPWICNLITDPDERVNLYAITLLGQLEDERALGALQTAQKDPNSRVRAYADEAVEKISAGIEAKNNKKK
ncbi:MAG: hypothetical protein A3J74_10880 [Elusimicrobia bacterium RIFCSPHIGHO2_02_FULL_57_9]|nr:MAG: hypothetical protein A3J74_10880 [Elusimicrobia bacterium RIFCSPHIGHO2_02_FULL_57_9]